MKNQSITRFARLSPNLLLVLLFAGLLSACGESGIKVTTQFDSPNGLEVGEAVMYEGQQVGTIADLTQGPNGVDVELLLNLESADLFHSKTVVVVNPVEEGTPVELYNRTTLEPLALQQGQELQGLNSMFELGAWMVGDAIQIGSGTLSDLFESFTGYLEGEQFQTDKEQVRSQLSAATLAAKEAVSSVETDINQALTELKASEGDISTAIEQMGSELSPIVSELSATGSELIKQLEQFATNLETQSQDNPQFGQELLDSLTRVFGELNDQVNQQLLGESTETRSIQTESETDTQPSETSSQESEASTAELDEAELDEAESMPEAPVE